MNRKEFMSRLEGLLWGVSPAEREEALQYYNDYFDDAGAENEQAVIETLGTPEKIAETIRSELQGEENARRASGSNREVIPYGKTESEETETGGYGDRERGNGEYRGYGDREYRDRGYGNRDGGYGNGENRDREYGNRGGQYGGGGGYGNRGYGDGEHGGGNVHEPPRKRAEGASCGVTALLIVLVLLALPIGLPVVLGALGTVFGMLVGWFAMILGFGVAAIVLLGVLLLLIIVGGMCVMLNPFVGLALWGCGLICGGLGILLLMLTVAMAGIVTPAIFRGIAWIFGRVGRRKAS